MPVSSVTATITLSEICFPDVTGKTIQAWLQVNFTPGTYTTGGLLMGLLAYADSRTVDFNGFLRASVWGEDVITSTVGGYNYHYSPVGDLLQIVNATTGLELASGAAIPVQVLSDIVLCLAVWNRTTVLG
jgi:uncharacterized membrane-anchored protein